MFGELPILDSVELKCRGVDRILVFDAGKLVADGPRDTILAAFQAGAQRTAASPSSRPHAPV
jgi:ABC-type glutathione transport system ATPase component